MGYYTVYTTFSDIEDARRLGREIVMKKLGGCVQIFKIDCSIYVWEGKLEEEKEYGMFIKTEESKVDEVKKFLKENHPYEIPQILIYRIDGGNQEYFNFIDNSLKEV